MSGEGHSEADGDPPLNGAEVLHDARPRLAAPRRLPHELHLALDRLGTTSRRFLELLARDGLVGV